MYEAEEVKKKHRGDSTSASSSSHDYCESPPAAQEIPWDMYNEDDDDDDDDKDAEQHDADFEFSPASPPLTQTTKGEEEEETSPPTLYVFPDSTVVQGFHSDTGPTPPTNRSRLQERRRRRRSPPQGMPTQAT